jgi:hypothetical protein
MEELGEESVELEPETARDPADDSDDLEDVRGGSAPSVESDY